MSKKFNLKIVTPLKVLFNDEVELVVLRTVTGEMGILAGHENYIAPLDYGILKIYEAHNIVKEFAVLGGFVEVSKNGCVVVSEISEAPSEIDKARAEEAKNRAEARIKNKDSNHNLLRAEIALKKSLVRIEVSKFKN